MTYIGVGFKMSFMTPKVGSNCNLGNIEHVFNSLQLTRQRYENFQMIRMK